MAVERIGALLRQWPERQLQEYSKCLRTGKGASVRRAEWLQMQTI